MRSIVCVLPRLFQSLIRSHLVLQSHQQILNSCRILPILKLLQILNATVGLVHRRNVDLVGEGKHRRLFGVFGSAEDGEEVDAIFKIGLNI